MMAPQLIVPLTLGADPSSTTAGNDALDCYTPNSPLTICKKERDPQEMAWMTSTNIFTDGSVKKDGRAGYGVFYQAACYGVATRLEKADYTSIVTVELRAISHALEWVRPGLQEVHICTDCEEALVLLDIYQTSPKSLRWHQDRELLERIVDRAAVSQWAEISLHKVRDHSGIAGDEAADWLAKQGACLPLDIPSLCFSFVPIVRAKKPSFGQKQKL